MFVPYQKLELQMQYSKDKDISVLVSKAVKSGWSFKSGRKHGSVFSPKGKRLIVPSTPSDMRAYYNFRNQMKKIAITESLPYGNN